MASIRFTQMTFLLLRDCLCLTGFEHGLIRLRLAAQKFCPLGLD